MNKKEATTFIKFCIVGGINTGIDLGLFMVLFYVFSAPLLLAHTLAFIVAATNSYLMNKYWAFSDDAPVGFTEVGKFLVVVFTAWAASSLALFTAANIMPVLAAKIAAIAVSVVVNYAGMRFLVFRNGKQ